MQREDENRSYIGSGVDQPSDAGGQPNAHTARPNGSISSRPSRVAPYRVGSAGVGAIRSFRHTIPPGTAADPARPVMAGADRRRERLAGRTQALSEVFAHDGSMRRPEVTDHARPCTNRRSRWRPARSGGACRAPNVVSLRRPPCPRAHTPRPPPHGQRASTRSPLPQRTPCPLAPHPKTRSLSSRPVSRRTRAAPRRPRTSTSAPRTHGGPACGGPSG